MRHGDQAQLGANTNETVLTLANVNSNSFGKLTERKVDGNLFAQPLIATGVSVPGLGIRNLLILATEHDTVYAFDADDITPGAGPIWTISFIDPAAGITPVFPADVYYQLIKPEIGITGTPVIDPEAGIIYVAAKTRKPGPTGTEFPNLLHALDLATGRERPGSPVLLTAVQPGVGYGSDSSGNIKLDQRWQLNRPGLVLVKNATYPRGILYVALGSFADSGNTHGWVLGIAADSLAVVQSFNTTPNGGIGAIWMAGAPPAVDEDGNLYFTTGNGDFDEARMNFSDSILKLETSDTNLTLKDYFTPFDEYWLSLYDKDLGSGGIMLLPDSAGTALHPHLAVACGKSGTIYLVDRDQMGHHSPLDDSQIVQSLPGALGDTLGAVWSSPAYFNGRVYYAANNDYLKAYNLANGALSAVPSSTGGAYYAYPGATPVISANGTSNAIVWAVQNPYLTASSVTLRAYNATNLAVELYNSDQRGSFDVPGSVAKFNLPVVANGKVYLPVSNSVVIYGPITQLETPVLTPRSGIYVDAVNVALIGNSAGEIRYTTDGTAPNASSARYTGPLTLTNSGTITARAFVTGKLPSGIAQASYSIVGAMPGHGTGLLGTYWSNQVTTLAGSPALTRVDPVIVSPDWTGTGLSPLLGTNNYCIQWIGTLQAQFNESYTLYASAPNSGVRLWLDGRLLIDSWTDYPLVSRATNVSLVAGRRYSIQLDYYHRKGNSYMALDWSSRSVPREHIPTAQLYPPNRPPSIRLESPVGGTTATGPATVSLIASASDSDGYVAKVVFYEGAQILGEVTNLPYSLTFTGGAAGQHSYYALAVDDQGATGVSNTNTITVTSGSGAPFGLGARTPLPAYLDFPRDAAGMPPRLISQTGAFTDWGNLRVRDGIIPYTVNVPFWSDGAAKRRWMAIPYNGGYLTSDQQIGFSPQGDWSFPAGTVFIKHFDILTNEADPQSLRRLETRFIVCLTNGLVQGATYKWRPDLSDADLVTQGVAENITIRAGSGIRTQAWYYPSPADCSVCHNPVSSGVLGASNTRQVNAVLTYPGTGVADNQMREWNYLGLFYPAIDEAALAGFQRLALVGDPNANVEWQARSFLDANCAYCHRPGGAPAVFDARITTPLVLANLIKGPSVAGAEGLAPVAPGDPIHSGVYRRVNTVDPLGKMPPLGRNVISSSAAEVLARWINSMVNFAPVPPAITTQTLSEWQTLTIANRADELSLNSTVSYNLILAPQGAEIDSQGVIVWTPSQSQSPSTNVFTVLSVANDPLDNDHPVLTATNSFTVVVQESNRAPVLPVIGDLTGSQWRRLWVTNTAISPNAHATVSYMLLNPPGGATIDTNGVISWSPSLYQVPGTTTITTVATANDSLDTINPVLRATNRFTVALFESNILPWWDTGVTNRSIDVGASMVMTNTARQPAIHAKLSYTLSNPPDGASIDGQGIIRWIPALNQAGSNNKMVTIVTSSAPYDPFNPTLTITNSFWVVVRRPLLGRMAGLQNESIRLTPLSLDSESFCFQVDGLNGVNYVLQATESLDSSNWTQIQILTNNSSPLLMRDTNIASFRERFYRVVPYRSLTR